jgi:5'-nucleotidase
MKRILVTNDDGVLSPGLVALARALSRLGEVTVVAPVREASAIGHALTLSQPLRFERLTDGVYSIDGTPTDCVNIAIAVILNGLPDLVASGINKGLNVGDDVTYSGTVSGALEGALLGVPSIAISLDRTKGEYDFSHAADAAARVAESILTRGLPARTFLNVNVQSGKPNGFRATVQARRNHVTSVQSLTDPRGRPFYWIGEADDHYERDDRSDYEAVRGGFISVTPLQPDLTAHDAVAMVEEMRLGEPAHETVAAADLVARPLETSGR